jgi:TorA maturation chaperone TorD
MLSGPLLAELETEYRSMGMSVPPSTAEGPDHVAVELAFIAFLCSMELSAWEVDDSVDALQYLDRQRLFLQQHPCRWLPHLSRALEARGRGNFYSIAAQAAQAMVAHDVDFLEATSRHIVAAG